LDPIWYAVSAKSATAKWEGLRNNAQNYGGGELNCVLGIDETALNSIAMYPNPANDEVFVAFSTTLYDTFEITVSNSLGQTLQKITDSPDGSNKISFSVANYRTGLYFITVTSEGISTTRKLLVN
jgi:hypothetical protein